MLQIKWSSNKEDEEEQIRITHRLTLTAQSYICFFTLFCWTFQIYKFVYSTPFWYSASVSCLHVLTQVQVDFTFCAKLPEPYVLFGRQWPFWIQSRWQPKTENSGHSSCFSVLELFAFWLVYVYPLPLCVAEMPYAVMNNGCNMQSSSTLKSIYPSILPHTHSRSSMVGPIKAIWTSQPTHVSPLQYFQDPLWGIFSIPKPGRTSSESIIGVSSNSTNWNKH